MEQLNFATQPLIDRYRAVQEQFDRNKRDLFQVVLEASVYQIGDRVRRVRCNEDGSVFDDITGTIVGMDVFMYTPIANGEEYPNIQYWVRVEFPEDYNSHQQCSQYGIELGKAEDFWAGDERWALLKQISA